MDLDISETIYPIELLSREPVDCDIERLLPALRKRLGRVSAARGGESGHAHFFLDDFPIRFDNGSEIAAQLLLFRLESPEAGATSSE